MKQIFLFLKEENGEKITNNSFEINVGEGFDEKYTLQSIMTIASIMDSQKSKTYLRLHLALVNYFSIKSMLKIYDLRKRKRSDVEFNFYNSKKAEIDFEGINQKGSSLFARFLLPELVSNYVKRLLIFDMGDVLILRNLLEIYNWNMKGNLYMGVLDNGYTKFGKISKKSRCLYKCWQLFS